MGGEGPIFYASQRPDYFGSAASFSGPLSIQRLTYQQAFDGATGQSKTAIYGDPQAQEFYWRGHNPKKLVGNLRHTRLYVAAGNGVPNPARPEELLNTFGQASELELGQHAAEFVQAAQAAGNQVTYDPHQGIHDWPYWRADLANAIEWGAVSPPAAPGRPLELRDRGPNRHGVAPALPFRAGADRGDEARAQRPAPARRGHRAGATAAAEVLPRRRAASVRYPDRSAATPPPGARRLPGLNPVHAGAPMVSARS